MTKTSRYSMTASEMNFRDLLQVLGRRKWLLLAHILVGLAIGVAMSYFGQEKWQAENQLEIQGRTATSSGFSGNDAISQLINRPSDFDLLTEIEILKSNEVYYGTLTKLGMPTPVSAEQFRRDFPSIKVEQATVSKVVMVTVTANSRELASQFAETLPQVYKESVDQRNANRVKSAIQTVKTTLAQTQKQIAATIKDLAKFQKSNNLTSARDEATLRATQELSAESLYTQALAEMKSLVQQERVMSEALNTIPKEKTEVQTQDNRTQIETERTGLQRLKQQRQELIVKFKPTHPRVKALDRTIENQEAYINELDKKFSVEVTRSNPEFDIHMQKLTAVRAELEGAKARVVEFKALMDKRSGDVEDLSDTTEQQYTLENKLAELQKTKERQQATLDELSLRDNPELDSPIRMVSGARVLAEQVAPKWTVNIILGIGLGLLLGIFVAVARELTLDRVNYPAEAVNVAGADILARIPIRPKSRAPLIDDPESARAFESYRLLRAGTVMKLQQVGQGAFLVTSSVKGEGKTVVAGNLGLAMALDGKQTCIVDCNLREPKLHKLFRVENDHGLTNVLLNRGSSLEAACLETNIPNLRIITAGTTLGNPTEALASPEMLAIVEQLKSIFDVVIFDCPDAYSVADTQELTRHVRNVLFVVELGKTDKSRMEQSVNFLRQASGRLLGIALNKDPQARARFS